MVSVFVGEREGMERVTYFGEDFGVLGIPVEDGGEGGGFVFVPGGRG